MRDTWQQRYQEKPFFYGKQPNAFLVSQGHRLRPGMTALALADGEGRNGVWLAQQGLRVTSVDYAEAALEHAQAWAEEQGVALDTECSDLSEWCWPKGEVDVVVAIFAHFPPAIRADLHRKMLEALRPGGVLILEAFSPRQLGRTSGGPKDLAMLYDVEMLRRDFQGGRIELLEEVETVLDEGPGHQGPAVVVRAIVTK
jgi:2-polyprenyl-3-methyl-5-hydroxy-6-metoxy-1,4-benzoquinol methylase